MSRQVERDYPVFVSAAATATGATRYYGADGVGYGRSGTYDEGTLIIDVIDPASQQIAWRGYGTSQSREAISTPSGCRAPSPRS